MATREILTYIRDGEFLYHLVRQYELVTATKYRYNPDRVLQIGGPQLLRSLAERNDLKLLPEEQIDDRATYVVEAKPKGGDWVSRHYFDKQTGIRLKLVELDEKGVETLSISLSELNFNPEFSEDLFTLIPPEGVEIVDKTQEEP